MAKSVSEKIRNTYKAKTYYVGQGNKYARINNRMRVIAASEVLEGYSFADVADKYGVTNMSVRNWFKTLLNNNPKLV